MTENEWLTENQPYHLLSFIGATTSDRKQRLAACAYSRLVWDLLCVTGREAVEIAERYAEGKVTPTAADEVQSRVQSLLPDGAASPYSPVVWALMRGERGSSYPPWYAASLAAMNVLEVLGFAPVPLGQIIRDIFGNPFRSVSLDPAWLTSDVLALARGIYDERAFDRMPILADALQDAGCDNDDILSHCRDASQVHVRGCWVVDLVLGKG